MIATIGRLPWTLADFPQGYVLLLHLAPGKKNRSSKPRRDFYLYGARLPHPHPAVAHACTHIWHEITYEPTCMFMTTTNRLDGRPMFRLAPRICQAR